jgi:hypothetical protein
MIKHICYINSNYLIIKTDKIHKLTSLSILNGNIINKDLFINDYKSVIKTKNILSTSLTILMNKYPLESDIMYYTNIFEELNYTQVNINSTSKSLENDTLIPNDLYYIIYHNKEYNNIYKYLLDDYLLNNNITKLKVISCLKLPKNNQCKYYYYSNSNNYFIN